MSKLSSFRREPKKWAVLCAIAATCAQPLHANTPLSSGDLAFGAATGSAGGYRPIYAAPAPAGREWAGAEQASCAGMDFKTFAGSYRASDLVSTWQNTYQNGPQKVALDYLIAVNTANPQLATAMDMLDRALSTRYQSFQALCQAQTAQQGSANPSARRAAEAKQQCFAAKITAAGASPDEALRDCESPSAYGSLGIPAEKSHRDFFAQHSNLESNPSFEQMLKLLPDEKIGNTGVQVLAPEKSVSEIHATSEENIGKAIQRIFEGADPSTVVSCTGQQMLGETSGASGCVPEAAMALVRSDSFVQVRNLPTNQRNMYKDAVASKASAIALRSLIQDMSASVDAMSPKNIDPRTFNNKKSELRAAITRLKEDADNLDKIAEARSELARIQLLAVRQANSAADERARRFQNAPANAANRSMLDSIMSFVAP